jgi:hypothetical protein
MSAHFNKSLTPDEISHAIKTAPRTLVLIAKYLVFVCALIADDGECGD